MEAVRAAGIVERIPGLSKAAFAIAPPLAIQHVRFMVIDRLPDVRALSREEKEILTQELFDELNAPETSSDRSAAILDVSQRSLPTLPCRSRLGFFLGGRQESFESQGRLAMAEVVSDGVVGSEASDRFTACEFGGRPR